MLVFLIVWALLCPATWAGADGTEIPITLYTDNTCLDVSTTATNVSLNLDVCTVTPGLGSYVLNPFPCSSGSVIGYVFSDTACGNSDQSNLFRGGGGDGSNPHCYGPIYGGLAALMLSCKQNTPGQPSSTTTINVGPIAAGASPTSTSSTAKGSGGDGSSSTNGSSGGGSSSTSATSIASSSSSPSGSWNSLDYGARIGIIVALAVGIPPILLGIYAIYMKKKKKAPK